MGRGNDETSAQTPPEGITFGMLPELIGYRLRIAQIGIFRDFCTSMDEAEITPTLFGAGRSRGRTPGSCRACGRTTFG